MVDFSPFAVVLFFATPSPMNILWLLLKASARNVAIAILVGLISGACSAQLIALINGAIAGKPISLPYFVGITLFSLLTTVFSQFLLIRLAQDAIYNLRLRLSRAILTTPLRQLEELGASRLLATLTEDVQSIADTIFAIPFLCIDLAIILCCMIYLGLQSVPVFLGLLAFMVFSITTVQYFLGRARKYLKRARNENDMLFKHFRTLTDGIKELKLNQQRRQAFFEQDLSVSANRSRHYNVSALTLFSFAMGWGNLLFFIIIGCILFLLPNLVTVSPSTLASFILTLTFLMLPFRNLLERLPILFKANVSLAKVQYMGLTLETNPEYANAIGINPGAIKPDRITLHNIHHTYKTNRDEMPFSITIPHLTIPAGQLLFIVGGNGSGKSTLAKLLTGLYYPESGELLYGEERITPDRLTAYRENFSVVFADFHLFDRIVSPHAHSLDHLDRHAQDYLEKLQIAHKVQVQEGLLTTTALSTGQRKRLALLHAYLEDRPIYLFDEWASDQDPIFRDLFYNHILFDLKQRGKTVLVISHDDRYFHLGDRILKLDYGQIESDRSPGT
ncbi:MAG: cyclic peptide export ABC transporter [Synechococcales bacterium]|nr:cyclic peptide export ABC transporter [Synechococcales bacterium]